MAATAEPEQAALDIAKMTKVQKIAALLVILGPESAAAILKHLDESEVEAIASEASKMALIDQTLQQAILREFSEVAVAASTGRRGGVEYTQQTLEKALGLFRAATIVNRVAPSRNPVAAMRSILEYEPAQIYNLLKDEQPQTIALLASYLRPEKASQVLFLLRTELRDQVVERLATLAPTPIEVVEKVVEVMGRKAAGKQPRAFSQTGGVKSAAAVLNALDKNASKMLLVALEERNPELVQAIQQQMFTFDDLAAIETTALQRILREVDLRELAIALKSANEKVKAALLGSISKRAAETVNEEISFLGALKLRDVEAAKSKIIEIVRRLEAEGEIDLGNMREAKNEAAA